jgi:hypothetical protein
MYTKLIVIYAKFIRESAAHSPQKDVEIFALPKLLRNQTDILKASKAQKAKRIMEIRYAVGFLVAMRANRGSKNLWRGMK